jgi:hypothetical protein
MHPTLTDELGERRRALAENPTIGALARRMRLLLEPLLEGPIYLPEQKPLLSRDGGVCPVDGARLTFDPLSPDVHRCPRCGETFEGERHHRAWIWRYHLWLSERAVQLALVGCLTSERSLVRRAQHVLSLYADLYPQVPNKDNVLGPTRLFFSTYLESIWLIQLIMAARLVSASNEVENLDSPWQARFTEVVVESAGLINSFDEGWSNRQVWNNSALVAAGVWLDDHRLLEVATEGAHGLRTQLRHCVGSDGMWYEGENYHFFALRGFLLGAEFLRSEGVDLYSDRDVGPVLRAMYLAPLETLLPDDTLPARSDAPFGMSVQRPGFAEIWEIGWCRTGEKEIERTLVRLYKRDGMSIDGASFAAIAEQEENGEPVKLDRQSLGWKALLWMRPEAPQLRSDAIRQSRLLPATGVAVLRNGSGAYLSVECGGNPGGHGHPDLLHVTLFWDRPILLDFGAGSYVSPSLHWYRSTLAHNAPGVRGSGQLCRSGWCAAFDRRDAWSWCRSVADDVFGPGTSAVRIVALGPRYALDIVEVNAPADVEVDLPIHPIQGAPMSHPTESEPVSLGSPEPENRHEHGYDAVERVMHTCADDNPIAGVQLAPRPGEELYLALAPGPAGRWYSDGDPLAFVVRRASGSGRWVQVYDPLECVAQLTVEDAAVLVRLKSGATERFVIEAGGLDVMDSDGGDYRLRGIRAAPKSRHEEPRRRMLVTCPILERLPPVGRWMSAIPGDAVAVLGEQHYRRSELLHGVRGPFTARVALFVVADRVVFAVDVEKDDLSFRGQESVSTALDNDNPDIHSDGVQCYLELDGWRGYVVIPEEGRATARVIPVRGTAGDASRVAASWCPTERGYSVMVAIDAGRSVRPGDCFGANLVVNEMYPERERRAGQLVWPGGGGWVYLRADRESPDDAAIVEVV